ncbi:Homeodomain-like protein [Xylariomycetidae sp. FL2044]|nr:Homeodomain-like protein [Xylariomycetidae sp. FL2044]
MQKNSGFNTGTWQQEEDERLRSAVARHGTRWVLVAADVSTRNGDQCAKRWNENLNPELDHSPWSPIEDKLLLHLVDVYGRNWKFLTNNFLESRAPLALKNRHSLLMRRMKRQNNQKQLPLPSGHSSPIVPTSSDFSEEWTLATDDQIMEQPDIMEVSPSSQHRAMPQAPWERQGVMHGFAGSDILPTSTAASGSNTPLELEALFDVSGEQSRLASGAKGSKNPSQQGAGSERSPEAVKYSVTCSRKNLRRLVCSIVDTALSETSPGENELVTMSLRLET